MSDLLFELDLMTGAMAAGVTLLVALGFVRLALGARGPIGHLAAGVLLLHLSVFLRMVYREIAPALVPAALWREIFGPAGATAMTAVLDLLAFYAGFHGLKALYLAIPEDERARYNLLTAAFYPPWRLFSRAQRDKS